MTPEERAKEAREYYDILCSHEGRCLPCIEKVVVAAIAGATADANLQLNECRTAFVNIAASNDLTFCWKMAMHMKKMLEPKGQCNKCGEGEAVMNGLCPECIRKQGFA